MPAFERTNKSEMPKNTVNATEVVKYMRRGSNPHADGIKGEKLRFQ